MIIALFLNGALTPLLFGFAAILICGAVKLLRNR